MLTKIVIDGVATFRAPATLETDKKVNLLYGLNGSGKSTIARFLRKTDAPAFQKCSAVGKEGKKVLVFNDDFVRENFYESTTFKGIFSLSKRNKEAEEQIAAARTERTRLDNVKAEAIKAQEMKLTQIASATAKIIDSAFEIKRKYSGGDRVLEFCLTGLLSNREKLFEHLRAVPKPSADPGFSVGDLQAEVRLLGNASEATAEPLLPSFTLDAAPIELSPLFQQSVVGTGNSTLGEAIDRLQNADWVRSGLTYMHLDAESSDPCPFCQKPTIDALFREQIRAYFDQAYEEQIKLLSRLQTDYESLSAKLPSLNSLQSSKFYDKQIDSKYAALAALFGENKLLIAAKLKSPSTSINLKITNPAVQDLISAITVVNNTIAAYNEKIANRESTLTNVKQRFWQLMRWQYDHLINSYVTLEAEKASTIAAAATTIADCDKLIAHQSSSISAAQKATVNVDDAIARINAELVDLGVLDFRITKHSHHLYQLERPVGGASTFHTLSEGEKMIIALLYFCELCDGNEAEDEVAGDRVVVIDDPISSMSHMYIFNVGRLLRSRFIDANTFSQVFILTHSLYFFYELADMNHERRAKTQALFRVVKTPAGSAVVGMKYEEIQNDYQAYWQVINDRTHSPALIANCMRNVVEYFFGFVEKKSYANVFQRPELSKIKFQAFSRYMNRESHSFGQNVFDLKEFNYEDFHEGLRQVFETCGYAEHYKQMARIQ